MGELTASDVDDALMPSAEQLLNLTEHRVVVQTTIPDAGGQGGSPQPAVDLPSGGRLARVDDEGARIGEDESLNSGDALVRLTRLRRSGRITGLPAVQPGTRYVVSRVTALAARNRGDLVFPFDEIRDSDGRIIGVRGLASFRPRWALGQRFRDWRAAFRARRTLEPLSEQWITAVMFASATALLSGAIGLLPGVVDNAAKNGWGGGGQFWASWLTVGFAAAGGGLLLWAALRWRHRGVVIDERGTAYVIEEQAITWRHEEKASVLAALGEEFARVLRVPGPEALGENWRWQAGAGGASHWDMRTDQLVHSFWSVHYNDDHVTRNALFTWAPWPVAMAFGARATTRRRGLVLHVRQRPSYGQEGPRQRLCIADGAHDFLRDEPPVPLNEAAPKRTVTHLHELLTVTIRPFEPPDPHTPGKPGHGRSGAARGGIAGHDASAEVLVLLVRVSRGPIGPIGMDLEKTPEVALSVPASVACSALPAGTRRVPVAEWRLDSAVQPVPQLPWQAFPAAAELIATWIIQQARDHPGHVVLLATRIPQELAVGLGIQLGQRARDWPQCVYPLYFAGGQLVVPDLMLGAESVPHERA